MLPFLSFETEENRALANLQTYYAQWIAATRALDTKLKGSMRWKAVGERQYLYHRVSSNPLVDNSLGVRSRQTSERMIAFKREQAHTLGRQQRALDETLKFARILRSMKLDKVDKQAAALLRHLDRKSMLGDLLMVVGTHAMLAYEVEAGGHIFRGFDATQDFDLTWRGLGALQLQASGKAKVSLIGTLREVDSLYTVNTERSFQATTGKYQVEFLAAPSTIGSFPFAKDDVAPLGDIHEQEWLMLGRPLRHIVVATDGTPAPIAAPDPRWMSLHKLWLSQKPKRQAIKKPKDQAQGLLLLRAVVETMPNYPLDEDFVAEVEQQLRPFLHMGFKWLRENPSDHGADQLTRSGRMLEAAWKKIKRMPLAEIMPVSQPSPDVPLFPPAGRRSRMRY